MDGGKTIRLPNRRFDDLFRKIRSSIEIIAALAAGMLAPLVVMNALAGLTALIDGRLRLYRLALPMFRSAASGPSSSIQSRHRRVRCRIPTQ